MRVVEKEDLEFFQKIEDAKRAQEERLRLEVESQVHQFQLKKQSAHDPRIEPPQKTASVIVGDKIKVSKQRDLLKKAIVKRKAALEERVDE